MLFDPTTGLTCYGNHSWRALRRLRITSAPPGPARLVPAGDGDLPVPMEVTGEDEHPYGAAPEGANAEGVDVPTVAPMSPSVVQQQREDREESSSLLMWETWERHCAVYLLSCALWREGRSESPCPLTTLQDRQAMVQTTTLCTTIWVKVCDGWYSFGTLPDGRPPGRRCRAVPVGVA